jgi:hypothetical protein
LQNIKREGKSYRTLLERSGGDGISYRALLERSVGGGKLQNIS